MCGRVPLARLTISRAKGYDSMRDLSFLAHTGDDGVRLDRFLRSRGVTMGLIRSVKHGDGFRIDGAPIHTNQCICAGQTVMCTLVPEQSDVRPQPVPFVIRYQDDCAAVLEKPAGLAVHPTRNYPDHTLANGWMWELASHDQTGVFRPINRLDKNTSGLVLVALDAYSAPVLAAGAHKRYLAVVEGEMPLESGMIDAPIARREDSLIGRCVSPNGKPSRTDYRVLCAGCGYSLVECLPRTGRTHQIRVHFSFIGHPLAGDDLYGGHRERIARHALHCARLCFPSPRSVQTGEMRTVTVCSPLPADMARLCEACGFSAKLYAENL